jgi:GNAT superfamily N-acetyltransferase
MRPLVDPGALPERIALRLASPEDAKVLTNAAARYFVETFGAANRPEDIEAYVTVAFSEQRQRAELSDARQRVWLATDADDELAGYAHVRLGARPPSSSTIATERPVEIARLYAGRRWHGRGLGAALMEACKRTAFEWGADALWLGVWEHNPRAISFYEKQGFRAVGEQSFMLGSDRQRDLVMLLRLTTES